MKLVDEYTYFSYMAQKVLFLKSDFFKPTKSKLNVSRLDFLFASDSKGKEICNGILTCTFSLQKKTPSTSTESADITIFQVLAYKDASSLQHSIAQTIEKDETF